jgi:hypothetical protein
MPLKYQSAHIVTLIVLSVWLVILITSRLYCTTAVNCVKEKLTMLEEKHFFWPSEMDSAAVRDKIALVLENSANAVVLGDDAFDWANLIHRTCFHFGINPVWVLISLQREQSLLGKRAVDYAYKVATGFTGKDSAGQTNSLWNGLATQIFMCAKNTAWYAGIGPDTNFGHDSSLWPRSIHRWERGEDENGYAIMLYDKPIPAVKTIYTLPEYCQLRYTPHISVLETNFSIFRDFVERPFYGG